jgi:hypothetical protein
MGLSLSIVALFVFVAFLVLLGGMAVAATRSVAPREGARAGHGCLGGCASGLVLVFLCLLGGAAFAAFFLTSVIGTAVAYNPIESIEVRHWDDETDDGRVLLPLDGRRTTRLVFEVRGRLGGELAEAVREEIGRDVPFEVRRRTDADGVEHATWTFTLPLSEEELRELEAEIRHELPELGPRLPAGVRIEFRGSEILY